MKKRIVSLLAGATILAAMLAGCAAAPAATSAGPATQEAAESAAEEAGATAEEAAESASGDIVEVMLAWETSENDPIGQGCLKWKEILEEKSGGQMIVKLYPNNQMGSKNDVIDQMLAGSNVITLADAGFMGERGTPDTGILMGPYMFDTWDDCWALVESDWWKDQCDQLAENGLKVVTSNWEYGLRHYLTKDPVHTVDDMAGMKIRVADSTIWIKGTEVLGATPTPMAFSEAYTALQQGVIDGIENPAPQLYDASFYEAVKNLTLTGHVKNFTVFLTSNDWFNTLTEEQQQWLIESGNEAGVYEQGVYAATEQEAIDNLKAAGVNVIELDEETYNGFKEKAKSFYADPALTEKWSDGLYDTVQAAMGK